MATCVIITILHICICCLQDWCVNDDLSVYFVWEIEGEKFCNGVYVNIIY